jgi:hypothetical protein
MPAFLTKNETTPRLRPYHRSEISADFSEIAISGSRAKKEAARFRGPLCVAVGS